MAATVTKIGSTVFGNKKVCFGEFTLDSCASALTVPGFRVLDFISLTPGSTGITIGTPGTTLVASTPDFTTNSATIYVTSSNAAATGTFMAIGY